MEIVFTHNEPYEAPKMETIDMKLEGGLLQAQQSATGNDEY